MTERRTLTVGVDARSLVGQPTGVGRYVKNLVRAMAAADAAPTLRLYLPAEPGPDLRAEGIQRAVLRMPPGPLDNVFIWNHVRLPLHLLRRRVDLLHGTFYTLPALCPCPAVVTIHDITFDLHPEWYAPRARLAFSGFAASSARKARHVLTVSECSRRDILRAYSLPADRVTAVPLAPDPEFRSVEDPGELARVRAAHELGEEYLLHVGSITPRRNLPRLLEAFASVRSRAPHLTLALAGRVEPPSLPLEGEIEKRGLRGAVRLLGYVSPADLPALYSGAAAVVYPSLYEGFGLPVLEAMACGAPVLASATSCFPEVAGDAALLVDPLDAEAMSAGIWSLLSDMPLRSTLVQRGRARAATFSWERAARETLAVYRRSATAAASVREPRA
jgi:glycosyltransferase involved in cell wall biosynthesis